MREEQLLSDIKPIIKEDEEVRFEKKHLMIMDYECIISKNIWKRMPVSKFLAPFWYTGYVGVRRDSGLYGLEYNVIQVKLEKELDITVGVSVERGLTYSGLLVKGKYVWYFGFDYAGLREQPSEQDVFKRIYGLVRDVSRYDVTYGKR